MSEMTLFKNGAALPDYLRNFSDDFTKSIASTGSGGRTISIKGGVFRMIVGGEEVAKNEDRAMNFVVVAAAPTLGRTFYSSGYEEGTIAGPACWSADSKVPDPSVSAPQSESCATCPQNIKGSGQGESRACRFNRRFAVVLEGDIGGPVYRLQLPATSLFGEPKNEKMPMYAYANFLAGHQVPISGVVTEARFDTEAAVPVLKFRAVRPLSEKEVAVSRAQGTSEEAELAIDMKYSSGKGAVATPVALPAPVAPRLAAAPVVVETDAEPAAPVKRASTKKPEPAPPTRSMEDIMSQWAGDDDA